MREVKVKKDELLTRIKANRDKHVAAYEEAVTDYKAVATKYVQDVIGGCEDDLKRLANGELFKPIPRMVNLDMPESHVKDYDQVILMLEMSVDGELMIKADEFACYVMDDWDWKEDFLETMAVYKAARR